MDTFGILDTPEAYTAALDELEGLLGKEVPRDDATRNRIRLLTLLIEDYERRHLPPHEPASAVEAIRFRMEQQGLSPRDLVKFLGSPSRVSEVLSGKRGLSLSMIRALNEGLGIPADALITNNEVQSRAKVKYTKGGMATLIARRGWLDTHAAEAVRVYVEPVVRLSGAAAFRRTSRSTGVDKEAIVAWTARVYHVGKTMARSSPGIDGNLDDLLRETIKLSWADAGPRLAVEFLRRHGVPVVIEPPLPKTHLDGVAIADGNLSVIGLTLRFDRIDSFWFTLAHEMAHLIVAAGKARQVFVDDLETSATDESERQADELARERLIPASAWRRSPASSLRSPQAAELLARELRIHPAIVAGRVRYESGSYRVLGNMLGQGEVRRLFPEVSWDD